MGAVEETRKLAQDFLAPELREIKSRLGNLESMSLRLGSLHIRLNAVEQVSAIRHEMVSNEIRHVANYFMLSERIARLEAQK